MAVRFLRSRYALFFGLVVCARLLVLCLLAGVRFGAARIGTWDMIGAFMNYTGSEDDLIIRTLRVPRALIAALVGASLAVAGAIMQGLTRNPLADPGILGIEAGAALAVVGAVFLLGVSSLSTYALFAFVGGAVAAVVYGLGSMGRGGMTPMEITIAGAALGALLGSLTTAVLILSQQTLEEIRFWLAGSVAGRDLGLLLDVLPYMLVGLVLSLALSRQVTTLSLGDDVAAGLGQRTAWVKALAYEILTPGWWRRPLVDVGRATNREDRAREVVADYDALVSRLRERTAPVVESSPRLVLLYAADASAPFVLDGRSAPGDPYAKLGFDLVAPAGTDIPDIGAAQVSLEVLGDLEADRVVLIKIGQDGEGSERLPVDDILDARERSGGPRVLRQVIDPTRPSSSPIADRQAIGQAADLLVEGLGWGGMPAARNQRFTAKRPGRRPGKEAEHED